MINQILEMYARSGESLANLGINEAALPTSEINEFLNLLKQTNLIIFGGDIYKKISHHFEFTYDNWYYNGNNSNDSIITARAYLEQFLNKNLFVSFVLK